jgi:hypothetical protein
LKRRWQILSAEIFLSAAVSFVSIGALVIHGLFFASSGARMPINDKDSDRELAEVLHQAGLLVG